MATIERRDVELTGAMTATVDATFVLAVSEAVSVASEPTLIDVYGARHEMTLGGDLVRSIPNARSYNALLPFMTGVLTSSNDVVTGTATTSFPIYGGRVSESRLLVDGLTVEARRQATQRRATWSTSGHSRRLRSPRRRPQARSKPPAS